MRRNWKTLGLAALTGLLLGTPALSARPPETTDDDLRREMKELRDEVAALRRDSRLTNAELKTVNERLRRIEEALERLRPTVTSRRSSYFTPERAGGVGHVRLVNRLGVTARTFINGVPYTVPPFATRLVREVPAGSLVYEVTADGFGLGPPVRTPLAPDETVTLTIY